MNPDTPSFSSTSGFRSKIRSNDTLDGDLSSPLIRPANIGSINDDFTDYTDRSWTARLRDRMRRGRARLWGSGAHSSTMSIGDSVDRPPTYGHLQYSEGTPRNSSSAHISEAGFNNNNNMNNTTPLRASIGGASGFGDDSAADNNNNNLAEFSSSDFRYSRRQSLSVRFKISKLNLDYWLRKKFSRFRDWPLIAQVMFLVPLPLYVGLLLFIFAVTNRHRPYLFFNRCDWIALSVAGALFQLGFFAAAIDMFPYAREVYVTKLNDLVDYYGVFFSYVFASIFYSMIVIIYILKDQSFLQQRKRQRRLRATSNTSDSLSSTNDITTGTSSSGSQRNIGGGISTGSQAPCSRRSAMVAMVIGTPHRSSTQRTVTGAAAAAAALTADPPSLPYFPNDLSSSLYRQGISPLTGAPQLSPNQQESCITPEIAAAAAAMMIKSSSFAVSSSSMVSSSDHKTMRPSLTSPKQSLSQSQRSRHHMDNNNNNNGGGGGGGASTTASQFSSSTGYRNHKSSASYFAPLSASTLHLPPPVTMPEREVVNVVRRSPYGIGSRDNSSTSNVDEKLTRHHSSSAVPSMHAEDHSGSTHSGASRRDSDRAVKVPRNSSRAQLSSSGPASGVEVEVSEDTECGTYTMQRSSGNDNIHCPQTSPMSGPHSVSNSTESSLSRPLFTHVDNGSRVSTNPNTEERFSMSYFVSLSSASDAPMGATRATEELGSKSDNNTVQYKHSHTSRRTPPSSQLNDWSALGIGDSQHHMADSLSRNASTDEVASQNAHTRVPGSATSRTGPYGPLGVNINSDEGVEDRDSDTVSNSRSSRYGGGPPPYADDASDVETQPPSAATSMTAYRGSISMDMKSTENESNAKLSHERVRDTSILSLDAQAKTDKSKVHAKTTTTTPGESPAKTQIISEGDFSAGRYIAPTQVPHRGAALVPPQNTVSTFQDRVGSRSPHSRDSRSSTDPHFIFETRASMKEKHLSPTAHAINRGYNNNRAGGGVKTRGSRDDMNRQGGEQRGTTPSGNSSGGQSRTSDRADQDSVSPTQLSPTLSGLTPTTPRTQQRQVRKSYRRQRGGHGADSPKQKARSGSYRSNDESGSQRASKNEENEEEDNDPQLEANEEQEVAETENKLLQRIRQQNMVSCITQSIFQDIVQEEQVCDVKADMIHLRLINHVEQRGSRIMFVTAPISLITVFVMRLRTMSTCPCESVSLMWDPEYIVEPLFWIHTFYWVQLIFGVLTLNFLALLIFYQQVQLVYYSTNLKKWYEEELKYRTDERRKQRAKEGYASPATPAHGPGASPGLYPGSPAAGSASQISSYPSRPAPISPGLPPAFGSPTGSVPGHMSSPLSGGQNSSITGVPTYSNYAVFNPYPNDPGYVGYFQLANHMHVQQTALMLAQTELPPVPSSAQSLSSSMIQALGGGSLIESARGGNGEVNSSFVKASPDAESSRRWGFLSSLGRVNSLIGTAGGAGVAGRSPTGTTPSIRPAEFALPPVIAGKLSDSTRVLSGKQASCGSSHTYNSNGVDLDEDVMGLVAFGWHDLSVPENMLVYFKVYNGIMEQISQTPGTAALCISSFITCIANFVTISILLSSLILSSLDFDIFLVMRGTVPFILVLLANTIAIGMFVYLLVGLTSAVEMQIKRITVVQSDLQKQIDRQHFAQYNKLVLGSTEEYARRKKQRRQRRRRHHRRHRHRSKERSRHERRHHRSSPHAARPTDQQQQQQKQEDNTRRGQREFPTAPPHSDFASAETLPGVSYTGTDSRRGSESITATPNNNNNNNNNTSLSDSRNPQSSSQEKNTLRHRTAQPQSSTSSTHSRSSSSSQSSSSSSTYSSHSRTSSTFSSSSSSSFSSSSSSSSSSFTSPTSSSSSSPRDGQAYANDFNEVGHRTRRPNDHSSPNRRRKNRNRKSRRRHRHRRNHSPRQRRTADANQVLLDISAASSSSSPAALRAKVNALKALSTYVRQSDVQPNLLGVSLDSMRWWVVIIFLTTLNAVFALLLLDVCFDADGLIPDNSSNLI